jgi:hypothetical protein
MLWAIAGLAKAANITPITASSAKTILMRLIYAKPPLLSPWHPTVGCHRLQAVLNTLIYSTSQVDFQANLGYPGDFFGRSIPL